MLPSLGLWSIDHRSGHCKHPYGLDAFIGSNDSERFTPVLGPYSRKNLADFEIATAIWDLAKTIEQPDGRVISLGTIDKSSTGKSLSVIGVDHPWTPDPSARTNWLLMCLSRNLPGIETTDLMDLIQQEWVLSRATNRILHHSGIAFRFTEDCVSDNFSKMIADSSGSIIFNDCPDTSIFHPDLISDSVYALAKAAYAVFSKAYGLDLPEKVLRLDGDVATKALNI